MIYMPQDGHWLANFEVIPPSPKELGFPRPKNRKFPALKTAVSFPKFWRFHFFGEEFVTPVPTLANIKNSLPTNSTAHDRLRY